MFRLKDDTKALGHALPKICVGHSAAVLTGLEHNHKRWLSVTRTDVLPTSCNDRFLQLWFGLKHNQPPPLLLIKTADGGCRSMFAIVKPDLRACTRLLSVAAAARRSQLLLPEARRCCWLRRTLGVSAAASAATRSLRCCCCCSGLQESPLLLQLRCSAAAAARLSAAPLLLHAALLLRCRSAAPLLLLAKRQQHLGACRNCCSLLEFSPRLMPGRKTKDASRSVTCAAACLGCVSMWW